MPEDRWTDDDEADAAPVAALGGFVLQLMACILGAVALTGAVISIAHFVG